MAGLYHWLLGLIPHSSVIDLLRVSHVKLGYVHRHMTVSVVGWSAVHIVPIHVARSEWDWRVVGVLWRRHHSVVFHFTIFRLFNLVFGCRPSEVMLLFHQHVCVWLAPWTQVHVTSAVVRDLVHIHSVSSVWKRLTIVPKWRRRLRVEHTASRAVSAIGHTLSKSSRWLGCSRVALVNGWLFNLGCSRLLLIEALFSLLDLVVIVCNIVDMDFRVVTVLTALLIALSWLMKIVNTGSR